MAMTVPNFSDPTSTSAITAYAWISETNFNWATSTGSITVLVHRDMDAAYANKAPIASYTYAITPDGANGTLNFSSMLAANMEAYGALQAALYGTLLSLPEWQGASV